MIPGITPMGAAATAVPTITFKSNNTSNTDVAAGNTYTFSTLAIGTADVTRIVACAIQLTGGADIASVTIGGITAIRAARNFDTGVFYAIVPTGTTATVVITTGTATANNCQCSVYTILGYRSAIPAVSKNFGDASSLTVFTMANVPVPAGAVGIVSYKGTGSGTVTLTSTGSHKTITEDKDDVVETNAARSAFNYVQTQFDAELVDITQTATSARTNNAICAAFWR